MIKEIILQEEWSNTLKIFIPRLSTKNVITIPYSKSNTDYQVCMSLPSKCLCFFTLKSSNNYHVREVKM